jgi:hypothetical protein
MEEPSASPVSNISHWFNEFLQWMVKVIKTSQAGGDHWKAPEDAKKAALGVRKPELEKQAMQSLGLQHCCQP